MYSPWARPCLPASAVDQRRSPPQHRQDTNQGDCAAQLNFLPRIVPKEQIAAIPADANVLVHSICVGESMSDFGNVGALDKTIAANPALEGALRSQGLRADDVVGIDIHNNGEGRRPLRSPAIARSGPAGLQINCRLIRAPRRGAKRL